MESARYLQIEAGTELGGTPVARRQNQSLEAIRGIAAVLVVAAHARYFYYLESGSPTSGNSQLEQILLFPTSFGREAVAVFFVLSGYFVGGQVVREVFAGRFTPRVFVAKRLSRFWLVLVPGLLVTALVDGLSRSLFSVDYVVVQGRDSSSLATALCNVGFLMDGRCETFGSNESLWSLGYEFWFYILFAAFVVGVVSIIRKAYLPAMVGLGVAVAAVMIFGAHLLLLIPAWVLGVGVAALRDSGFLSMRLRKWRFAVAGASVAVLGLMFATLVPTGLPVKYAIVGFAVAPLVLVLATLDPKGPVWLRPIFGFLVWMGSWSFTLYVFHLPFVMLMVAFLTSRSIEASWFMCYGIVVAALACAYPMYWVGEAYTNRVRNWALGSVRQ
ncbi:acyltransferase family protein [Rhodococcus aetherivorans]|uniref:acyltransferase family protein n=1 Tax=Rhodococcus aetherivorans TaxID=191292 RepID=UPI0036658FBD